MRVLALPILFGVLSWLCYVLAKPRRRKES